MIGLEADHRRPAGGPPAPEAADEKLHIITSPIVGTFYRAPSPTAEPFVTIGDEVEAGQDALHHRGDEAHERDTVGGRRADRARSSSRTASRSSTASRCSGLRYSVSGQLSALSQRLRLRLKADG